MNQTGKVVEPHSCGYAAKTADVSYLSNHQCAGIGMRNNSSACTPEQLITLPTEYVGRSQTKKTAKLELFFITETYTIYSVVWYN